MSSKVPPILHGTKLLELLKHLASEKANTQRDTDIASELGISWFDVACVRRLIGSERKARRCGRRFPYEAMDWSLPNDTLAKAWGAHPVSLSVQRKKLGIKRTSRSARRRAAADPNWFKTAFEIETAKASAWKQGAELPEQ